ncbi:MAG: nuclear transport factor 2 family protein [Deltaproteobacteria bacterium]|nr:nuclear transport factor 2 family protein [Deltaproteobacteria bacterium]
MDTTINTSDQPNAGRRSFIWKAGAAVSALLATAVPAIAMPVFKKDKGLESEMERLNSRVASLEDEKSIHALYRTYESLLERGSYEDLVELFSNDGEVIFNSGVYKGKETGVRRLYCSLFRSGMTGKRISPAPGFETACESAQDHVQISDDRGSANGRFSYSMQIGVPLTSDSVLVSMARLHGGGVMRWWEGGTCHISCVKEAAGGAWKIKRLEYHTLAKRDYRPGKTYSTPVSAVPFAKAYPEEPNGPDKILVPVQV